MKTIQIRDDAHWHELRSQHVGGSEVAALFGEHPQLTKFELWHQKMGKLPMPDLSDNERVFWGTILEPAIAQGVSAKTGWTVRKVRRYHSLLPNIALGASLDYEIVGHDRGPGVLEIKTADWLVTRRWEEGEPPLAYELQLQSYLGCVDRAWGCMAVLVGGNELRLFEYERRPKTIATIKAAVAEFWRSIDDNVSPKPDFERDGAALAKVFGQATPGKIIDLSTSNRLPELCAAYLRNAADEKAGESARAAAKAEILTLIGDAEIVTCGPYRLSAGTVAASPDKIITAEMVGTAIKGRSGYRNLRVTERKERTAA